MLSLSHNRRIPLSTTGLILMLTPAVLLLLFVLLLPFWQLKIVNICVTLTAVFGSAALYYIMLVSD